MRPCGAWKKQISRSNRTLITAMKDVLFKAAPAKTGPVFEFAFKSRSYNLVLMLCPRLMTQHSKKHGVRALGCFSLPPPCCCFVYSHLSLGCFSPCTSLTSAFCSAPHPPPTFLAKLCKWGKDKYCLSFSFITRRWGGGSFFLNYKNILIVSINIITLLIYLLRQLLISCSTKHLGMLEN